MKLSKETLKRIIKEELEAEMQEGMPNQEQMFANAFHELMEQLKQQFPDKTEQELVGMVQALLRSYGHNY